MDIRTGWQRGEGRGKLMRGRERRRYERIRDTRGWNKREMGKK